MFIINQRLSRACITTYIPCGTFIYKPEALKSLFHYIYSLLDTYYKPEALKSLVSLHISLVGYL
jgi:Mlc titration factor MtfA (ptsG expression regulator)